MKRKRGKNIVDVLNPNTIKEFRYWLGLSQRDFAKKYNLRQITYQRFESGVMSNTDLFDKLMGIVLDDKYKEFCREIAKEVRG